MFAQKYRQRLLNQKKSGLFRDPPAIGAREGKYVHIDGRKILNFSSNDYLGLGDCRELREKACRNFRKYGCSASASRLVCANHEIITEAENRYARYFGYDDALFFQSGYQANLAVISTLFEKEDMVLFDKHIHASSVKGLTMSGCRFAGFNHNDMDHLEKRLKAQKKNKDLAVLTESLFSMDGDFLDTDRFSRLKRRHGFLSIVDEAHSFGACGPGGRGIGRECADIAMGTFGKALGLFGAFALLPDGFKQYLFNFASPLIYSTSLPPAHAAIAIDLLELVEKSQTKRDRLVKNHELLKKLLTEKGYRVHGDAHILAVEIGDEKTTARISQKLLERGIFVFSARYPTVPLGKAILRLSLTALHDADDIFHFLEHFEDTRHDVNSGKA